MWNAYKISLVGILTVFLHSLTNPSSQAQNRPNVRPPLQDLVPTTPPAPLPTTPQPIPSPEELLPSPPPASTPPANEQTITVTGVIFSGNTVFSDRELAQEIPPDLLGKPVPVSRLLELANRVAQRYANAGYKTSGAVVILPRETQERGKGIVEIKVIEGELESIEVSPFESSGLNPEYVRSRIAIATGKPLNINRLQSALQLLQINPLISRISAELVDGSEAGKSILRVQYATVPMFHLQANLDNNRAPSIGSFERGVGFSNDSLLGWGDRLAFDYTNTDGSNEFETSYEIPWNPRNGTAKLRYRNVSSEIITEPFAQFDIRSYYQQYEFTLRQPMLQTPQQELAVGLSLDRQESSNTVRGVPFPLSPGANIRGETNITTLRFFQEWVDRSESSVIAARSSFSFGTSIFGVTEPLDVKDNPLAPLSQYFMWRGQAQWVRSLGADAIFLIRSDLQLTPNRLVPLEQFAIGGYGTVRGYAPNTLLTDNGFIFSTEARLPILRLRQEGMLLQLIPFVDFGIGWNVKGPVPSPNTLASVGLGLSWQYGDKITARLDWGIPLTPIKATGTSLQEQGIYFSITISPF